MMEKKRKKRNTRSDVIFIIFSLFVCPAVAIKFGEEKCLLSYNEPLTPPPPSLGKYKKRNRITHIFLKFAFL